MAHQFMTFQLADRLMGIDIMAIREIRAWTPTTKLPNAPSYVRGVVNLRGTVLPVIDLSDRLGWGRVEPTERNVIIVLEILDQMHGLIVDSVNDIVIVEESSLQPPPVIGMGGRENFLQGLALVEDRMAIILKLEGMAMDLSQSDLANAA
ncbi:chemotaxis protein CheW [Blastomonas sp. AAP53]|uniref:chemotaxis protein CheW n=1 Tax=Blastomonas sp. AAP53 TaxID=1248760 RepID=UPI0003002F4E|nr:chemotaxis protein CheW [Blastomonas sp. AAP53]